MMLAQILHKTTNEQEASRTHAACAAFLDIMAPSIEKALNITSITSVMEIRTIEVRGRRGVLWYHVILAEQENAPGVPGDVLRMMESTWRSRIRGHADHSVQLVRPREISPGRHERGNMTGPARKWGNGDAYR